MGKEAVAEARIGAESGSVRVLLEAHALIVRGGIRRQFARERLFDIAVDGDVLRMACGGEAISLTLGADAAKRWAKALVTSPRSLREKLGLGAGGHALCVGEFADPALGDAVAGALADNIDTASIIIACVKDAADLDAAVAVHDRRPELPLWTVYAKGNAVAFGERAVRETLREKGFRDTKICSVSDALTACRYNRAER